MLLLLVVVYSPFSIDADDDGHDGAFKGIVSLKEA